MAEQDTSLWKRLQRLFRSGPVLRHKIATGEKPGPPQGSAKAYKKELSSLYVRAMASYANHERLSRYTDYQEMETMPELHSALDIYADETTIRDEDGHVIKVTSRNQEIKEILEELFFDILNIDFEAWSWVRHLCKFGDLALFIDANEENGILQLYPIPINEIEREEGYDPKDPYAVRFRWLTRGNMIIENWQIIHFRLLGNDAFLPYGCSMLEPARRIWRQLILIEDAMLVYRIVRAPERRVFHIEVGAIPPEQVEPFMEQVKTATKRSTIVDPDTGRVDLRYNPVSVEEDYWFPKRGEVGSRVESLPGGQFVGDVEDVQYIQSKMFAAIKIPRAYLGYEDQIGCLTISTTCELLDGRTLTIGELLQAHENGEELWAYSCTRDGKLVPGKIAKVWATKQVETLHRVTLDDGSVVECTENHPFMMRDGSYRRADQLVAGDSLMPAYRRQSSHDHGDSLNGYEMCLDQSTGTWEYTHKIVERHGIERDASADDRNEGHAVVHHKDFNKLNNCPSNLITMGKKSHAVLHAAGGQLLNSKESRDLLRETMKTDAYKSAHRAGVIKAWENNRTRKQKLVESNKKFGKAKLMQAARWTKTAWNEPTTENLLSTIATIGSTKIVDICRSGRFKKNDVYKLIEQLGYRSWVHFVVWNCGPYRGAPAEFRGLAPTPTNHKVLSIEMITLDSPQWVYDIEIDGPHSNFVVEKSVIVHNSKATLAQEDIRFAKTIERVQQLFLAELKKIAIIHLYILGYSIRDCANFDISMASPSTVAQQQRLELWRMKLEVAGMAQEGVFDRGTMYRRIFDLNDTEIAKIKEGKRIDRLEDALLESMEAPEPVEPGAPAGPGAAPPEPGAEELPTTLGGPPGGGPPEVAGFVPQGQVIGERFNRGSAGNDAMISTVKGKDLFATGEDLFAHTFGTEKQTMSDPFDVRAQRRLRNRPLTLTNGHDPTDDGSSMIDDRIDELDEALQAIGRWLDRRSS